MQLKRVVVTGLGALTPLGNTLQEYWNGLINGISGADVITLFDASKFKTRFACEVKGFDASKFNLIALDNNTNGYTAVNNKNALYRFCSNAALGTCNWLIPDAQIPPFCSACELNRTIPELGNFKNQEK